MFFFSPPSHMHPHTSRVPLAGPSAENQVHTHPAFIQVTIRFKKTNVETIVSLSVVFSFWSPLPSFSHQVSEHGLGLTQFPFYSLSHTPLFSGSKQFRSRPVFSTVHPCSRGQKRLPPQIAPLALSLMD